MARYAIGDVQGCYDDLCRLLERIDFDDGRDELWFCGDLVNRGPGSLEVLRFVHKLGERARCVLGNHDLHLLAIAHGARDAGTKDTLDDILAAPDREELLDWLQHRPLIVRDDGFLLVHAGLPPQWDADFAAARAAEVEAVLRSDLASDYFAAMYGNEPAVWDDTLQGGERWRVITNYLTRMRLCHADGRLDLAYKGPPEGAHDGFLPWFEHEDRRARDVTILFGHWAALQGAVVSDAVIALDTGCVWGGCLRAVRLEDRAVFECAC